MNRKNYTYEIIDIDQNILERLTKKLSEGQSIIQEIKENKFTPTNISWVKSFVSFICEIDPYGEEYSDSLASQWYSARWYNGNHPKTNDEQNIVLSQYLAVIDSLKNGKAKVVKNNLIMQTNSIYHRRDLSMQNNLVFTLMPFTENWSNYIWNKEIKPNVEGIKEYNLICTRADDLYGYDVVQDIYESILRAAIIIADITNRNANVFYELGIAHALGKEVILITQGEEHIPFDLKRFRHCIYSNDGVGYEKLREYLPNAIREILNKEK